MTRRIRLVGLLLLACMALAVTVAPQVVRIASRIAPSLTSVAGATAKDNLQPGASPSIKPEERSRMQTSFEQDAKKIESLDSSKKLSEVRDLIKDLKLKWSGTSGPYYSRLMLRTCKTLNSLDLGDKGQFELAYTNAIEVLAQPHRFPDDPDQRLDMETGLVLCLNHDLGDPSWNVSPGWETRRRINAEKFLNLWQRVRNQIDPNFNFADMPLLNVPAPAGTGAVAGTDPAAISDPKKRTEYEAAIQANREKANAYNLQRKLRTTAETLEPHLKAYLIAAYSKSPSNIPELQGLLTQYHVSESLKKEIMEELNKPTP